MRTGARDGIGALRPFALHPLEIGETRAVDVLVHHARWEKRRVLRERRCLKRQFALLGGVRHRFPSCGASLIYTAHTPETATTTGPHTGSSKTITACSRSPRVFGLPGRFAARSRSKGPAHASVRPRAITAGPWVCTAHTLENVPRRPAPARSPVFRRRSPRERGSAVRCPACG